MADFGRTRRDLSYGKGLHLRESLHVGLVWVQVKSLTLYRRGVLGITTTEPGEGTPESFVASTQKKERVSHVCILVMRGLVIANFLGQGKSPDVRSSISVFIANLWFS